MLIDLDCTVHTLKFWLIKNISSGRGTGVHTCKTQETEAANRKVHLGLLCSEFKTNLGHKVRPCLNE